MASPIVRLFAVLMLLVVVVGCGSAEPTAAPAAGTAVPATGGAPGVRVVTTMSILADVIRNVGGERVSVENIIPLGAGPEDYQPTPGDAQKIADAQIVFFNGHALEEWLEPLFENAGGANQKQVELSAGLDAIDDHADEGDHADEPAHDEEGDHADEAAHSDEEGDHADEAGAADEHAHEEGNPHFWLDPTYVMSYTLTIRDELTALDPDGAATYAANADAYIVKLKALDAELAAQAATLEPGQRKLVTNHDAFPYFAKRYGFEVIGVILANPEAELSAGELSNLIDTVKDHEIKAIFSESQFNQRTSELLASEAGLDTIGVLYTDTLGEGEASDYLALMRYNMTTIVEALR